MTLTPLHTPRASAMVEQIALRAADGTELSLRRVTTDDSDRPAVLLLHGHGASSDTFTVPEIRNIVDTLLDAGYEPWLLDWRGSCKLPYNTSGGRFSYDDVALYDIPGAVDFIRGRIGDRKLFVVAHCIGAITLSMSMAAGLVPGLAGVVAQGVFLTPKMSGAVRARTALGAELIRTRTDHIPSDFRNVGMWSRFTPLFALLSRRGPCTDPTCAMVHSNWGAGGELFLHDNLDPITHGRLSELLGAVPTWTVPNMRRNELAHAVLRWNDNDDRYSALPTNALDNADRIDCPVLLLAGNRNKAWFDSNRLCHSILADRHPQLDVRYTEIPGYGHLDTFIGRGAALDVFGHILDFLDEMAP
jgi:alpha-beta hydrolase superfamily lysophospholipase